MIALRLLLIVWALGWITSAHAGDLDVKPDSRIELLYLSANDCRYCRSWQQLSWKRFSQTPEAQYVRLIKVDRGSLRFAVSENLVHKKQKSKKHTHTLSGTPSRCSTVAAALPLVMCALILWVIKLETPRFLAGNSRYTSHACVC